MNNMSVARDNRPQKRPATRRGFHAILAGDVILHDKWDAMQWTADFAAGALSVESFGDLESIGVEL